MPLLRFFTDLVFSWFKKKKAKWKKVVGHELADAQNANVARLCWCSIVLQGSRWPHRAECASWSRLNGSKDLWAGSYPGPAERGQWEGRVGWGKNTGFSCPYQKERIAPMNSCHASFSFVALCFRMLYEQVRTKRPAGELFSLQTETLSIRIDEWNLLCVI